MLRVVEQREPSDDPIEDRLREVEAFCLQLAHVQRQIHRQVDQIASDISGIKRAVLSAGLALGLAERESESMRSRTS